MQHPEPIVLKILSKYEVYRLAVGTLSHAKEIVFDSQNDLLDS